MSIHHADYKKTLTGNEIAIIGMASRFPKARNIEEFWQNLYNGVEAITCFSTEALRASGIPQNLLDDSHFVRSKGVLENSEYFDAAFFGYSLREAEITDPQQRLFLECAWHALEHAGYDPQTYPGLIGLYAGMNMNTYYAHLLACMSQNPELRAALDNFQLMLSNDKDYLTTRVSYKLNLRGPSITVQTACSTSLVAVHLACQSLLNGECDLALAGGVGVHAFQNSGYYYREGDIASPDGHCRAFDARAEGTFSGNGLGIVVLKRLIEALDEGDTIHAVIKGSACNNDGTQKIGYTAPSVQGQAKVISEALAVADVLPESIHYIEAHGTATPLGDPIEIRALTQAFQAHTEQKQFCAVGSVKTNIGHLGAAAGIAGLIKTVLALKHRMLPPSLHFERPNPHIDFVNSPFYVNKTLAAWQGDFPLRAGVSSFGIGGTNAHIVLEEAPDEENTTASRYPWQLIVLSAKTDSALEQVKAQMRAHLCQHPETALADLAFTLQVGRACLPYRTMLVCRDLESLEQALELANTPHTHSMQTNATDRPVAFLFPGQGAQYVFMGKELYETEPVFQYEIDRCATLLLPYLGIDIRQILYPPKEEVFDATQNITQTWLTQPILFVIEYALARVWQSWGVIPQGMIGHSIGEYVAACLASVLSLEDALQLVAARGQLMQQVRPGVMVALSCSRTETEQALAKLASWAAGQISIAASNAPAQIVVSGPEEAIRELETQLSGQEINNKRLKTSHAFHSLMVEPILADFREQVCRVTLRPPEARYISNLTGNWITAAQATDPNYWVQHLRQEVRFMDGITTLLSEPDMLFVEVGPGNTLKSLVKQQSTGQPIINTLPRLKEKRSDIQTLLTALGQLWLAGANITWSGLHAQERRRRIVLPTYPFESQRYWVDVDTVHAPASRKAEEITDTSATLGSQSERREERTFQSVSTIYNRPALTATYVAPRTEFEEQVAHIWSTLIGVEPIGIHDDFFELGGHSLLATQVLARLRSQLHIDIPLRILLEKPTVEELVASIQNPQQHLTLTGLEPNEIKSHQEENIRTELNTLSDAEIDALLQETLGEEE